MVKSGDGGARIDEPFTPKSLLSLQNQSLQFKNAVTLQPFCLFAEKHILHVCIFCASSLHLRVSREMYSLYSVQSPPWVLLPHWTRPALLLFFLSRPRTRDLRSGLEHRLTS